MCFCRALNDGKSKPAAPRLTGDEGIEQFVTNIRMNTRTAIAHQYRKCSALELGPPFGKLVSGELATLYPDLAVRRCGLHGIEEKIPDGAMQKVLIAFHYERRLRKEVDDLHARRRIRMSGRQLGSIARDRREIELVKARR